MGGGGRRSGQDEAPLSQSLVMAQRNQEQQTSARPASLAINKVDQKNKALNNMENLELKVTNRHLMGEKEQLRAAGALIAKLVI
jgi:hypothetical protein